MIGHKLEAYSAQLDHSLGDRQALWAEHSPEEYWALVEKHTEHKAYSAVAVLAEHMIDLAAKAAADKAVWGGAP